jgi:hypothetical protein
VDVADEEEVEDLQHHQRVHRHGLRQGERIALVDGIGEDAEDRRKKEQCRPQHVPDEFTPT